MAAAGIEARREVRAPLLHAWDARMIKRDVPQRVNARLANGGTGAEVVQNEAAPPSAASTAAGLCERQVLASQQHLQALVARFSDELADARTVGDAREAAYIREKAARSQRLRDKAEASEAARAATLATVEASRARLMDSATPQDALSELNIQQSACAEEDAQKASVFADLSRDIKLQDQVYEKELDKQSVDTNALLKLATTHLAELRRAFDEETKLVEASLEQERRAHLEEQQRELDDLMAQRNEAERQVAEAAEERALAHQAELHTCRLDGIAECNALAQEVDDRVQALERRLASVHAGNILAADQLGVRASKLADKDSDNAALAQQLKRNIARQRESLMANKERWAASEKALREEYAKLKDDHTRSLTQFQQLDAKHAVLESADSRRRAEVALTDGEMLSELGSSCASVSAELQKLGALVIDGAAPDRALLEKLAAAIAQLVDCDDVADATSALHLLDTLNAAVNSQRATLEARQAIVSDINALRSRRAVPRTPGRM